MVLIVYAINENKNCPVFATLLRDKASEDLTILSHENLH